MWLFECRQLVSCRNTLVILLCGYISQTSNIKDTDTVQCRYRRSSVDTDTVQCRYSVKPVI